MRCKWHSNPNLGRNGVKKICAVRLVGASLLKFLEGFCYRTERQAFEGSLA